MPQEVLTCYKGDNINNCVNDPKYVAESEPEPEPESSRSRLSLFLLEQVMKLKLNF